ncbi:MAG: hypothetical protein KBD37_06485 [Burkholderiales bacterium]|nr:hypothetical protein [Burkholderiales bacterium]
MTPASGKGLSSTRVSNQETQSLLPSAKLSGQRQLYRLNNLKLTTSEAGALIEAIYNAKDAAEVTTVINNKLSHLNQERRDILLNEVNHWREARSDHRSLFCHYGDTEHSKVAHKYLSLISSGQNDIQDVTGRGHGPMGFIKNRDYSIRYDPCDHVDDSNGGLFSAQLPPSVTNDLSSIPTDTPSESLQPSAPGNQPVSGEQTTKTKPFTSSVLAPSLASSRIYTEGEIQELHRIKEAADIFFNKENANNLGQSIRVNFVKVDSNMSVPVVSLCSSISGLNPKPEACYLFVESHMEPKEINLVRILNPVDDIHNAIKDNSAIRLNYDFHSCHLNDSAEYNMSTIATPYNGSVWDENEEETIYSEIDKMRQSKPYVTAMNQLRNQINHMPDAEMNVFSTTLTEIVYYKGKDDGGYDEPKFRAIFKVGCGGYNENGSHRKYLYCGVTLYNNGKYEVMTASSNHGETLVTDDINQFHMMLSYKLAQSQNDDASFD